MPAYSNVYGSSKFARNTCTCKREREREIIPVIVYDRVFISILHVRVYRVNEAGDNPIAGGYGFQDQVISAFNLISILLMLAK